MALTNLARDMIADALIGGTTYNKYTNANTYIGVGDSSTAYAAAQTDLQASTNKHREPMDSTYPSRSSNVVTFKATFETGDANFTWNEWGIFNASSSGQMLNRVVQNIGTKTSAAVWEMTVTLTITL